MNILFCSLQEIQKITFTPYLIISIILELFIIYIFITKVLFINNKNTKNNLIKIILTMIGLIIIGLLTTSFSLYFGKNFISFPENLEKFSFFQILFLYLKVGINEELPKIILPFIIGYIFLGKKILKPEIFIILILISSFGFSIIENILYFNSFQFKTLDNGDKILLSLKDNFLDLMLLFIFRNITSLFFHLGFAFVFINTYKYFYDLFLEKKYNKIKIIIILSISLIITIFFHGIIDSLIIKKSIFSLLFLILFLIFVYINLSHLINEKYLLRK